MPVRRTINRRERGVLFAAAGLVGLALILGVTLRKPFALAEGTWQGGQYTDSSAPGRDRSGSLPTTRSGTSQVALTETAVQRPRLQPGEAATLRAVYDVPGPTQVRETRIIRYDGLVLARIERVMARTGGSILSEYRVNVPRDAADGWYSVTTSVERIDAVTRGGAAEQKETGFYVDAKGAAAATPAPRPGNTDEKDAVAVKLSANQAQYKIGDRLILSFEANRDAFLTIVNVGTSGEVSILFPNRFSGGHAVKAGRAYRIPDAGDSYELEVKGPPGVELVYALLTLKPVLFLPMDFPSTGAVFHSTSEKVTSFTRDINVAAKSIPLREQAKAILELEVTR
jgi:hypothetical protein